MIYVVDTHALLWYLEGSRRLPRRARQALDDPSAVLIVSAIVLAEAKLLLAKQEQAAVYEQVVQELRDDLRFQVNSVDEGIIEQMSTALEIHDAIICATALILAQQGEEVAVLTADRAIRDSGLVQVVWQ
ncbi:MAG: PIN domain-containing protein [Chloroflexi bacterium]|nr:PIN domain-containing protein [Chloroflexota bacterium]